MVPHLVEQVVRGVGQGPDLSLHRGRADGDVTVCGITVAVLGSAFVALLPLDFFLRTIYCFLVLAKNFNFIPAHCAFEHGCMGVRGVRVHGLAEWSPHSPLCSKEPLCGALSSDPSGWAGVSGTGNVPSTAYIREGPLQGAGPSPRPGCCGRPHGPPCPGPSALPYPTAWAPHALVLCSDTEPLAPGSEPVCPLFLRPGVLFLQRPLM